MPVTVVQEGDPKKLVYWRVLAHAAEARLPIAVYAMDGLSWFRGSFSKWNELVHVAAPTRPVPIATVLRT